MRGIRPLLAALVLVLSAGGAWAVCPGLTVQFEDRFDTFKPSWGDPSADVKVENGNMILAPASGTYDWRANSAALYGDIDMCVSVTTLTAVQPMDAKAGLLFWYDDVNNFYVFEIAPNGRASVWRRQNGKWLAQVKWADVASVNKDDGAINELRVTTTGSDAVFYVNGTEFNKISGSPPKRASRSACSPLRPMRGRRILPSRACASPSREVRYNPHRLPPTCAVAVIGRGLAGDDDLELDRAGSTGRRRRV